MTDAEMTVFYKVLIEAARVLVVIGFMIVVVWLGLATERFIKKKRAAK
jgi:hypothetical protein